MGHDGFLIKRRRKYITLPLFFQHNCIFLFTGTLSDFRFTLNRDDVGKHDAILKFNHLCDCSVTVLVLYCIQKKQERRIFP